jgi:hypothetical protein
LGAIKTGSLGGILKAPSCLFRSSVLFLYDPVFYLVPPQDPPSTLRFANFWLTPGSSGGPNLLGPVNMNKLQRPITRLRTEGVSEKEDSVLERKQPGASKWGSAPTQPLNLFNSLFNTPSLERLCRVLAPC